MESNPHKYKYIPTICVCGHVDVGKSTFVGRLLSLGTDDENNPICVEPVEDYAKNVDTIGEIKEKNKGATENFACNQLQINGHKFCVIDNPGHLELLYEVAKSLHLTDVLVLLCEADKMEISIAYCKLIKFIAEKFTNIRKTVLIINKIDLCNTIDEEEVANDLGADLVFTSHNKTSDEEFLDIVESIIVGHTQTTVPDKKYENEVWLFDIDENGHKNDQLYIKADCDLDIPSCELVTSEFIADDLKLFSEQTQSKCIKKGEYFTAKLKDKSTTEISCGMYKLNQEIYNKTYEIRAVGKINREGALVSLQKYTGYYAMQYFECDLRGKDTIRPVKSSEEIEIEIVSNKKITIFDDISEIILFNKTYRNPIIFIGRIVE